MNSNAQFPGSGRTLTASSAVSSMWGGGGGGSYPSGGAGSTGGSLESRQALAARRLAALSQGKDESSYGSGNKSGSSSPYFAGASAPPLPVDPSSLSALKVR
jgi:hypothetical protein